MLSSLSALLLVLSACTDTPTDTGEPLDTSADCVDEIPYDGIDNDCDASTPDDDLDGDGLLLADDCDDTDATLGGEEVPYDGLDNDCDPQTLDDDLDADGALAAVDCDDADPTRYPDADEICDGIDNNCNELVDDDPIDPATWYADTDQDGYGDLAVSLQSCDAPSGYIADSGDCDDTLSSISPVGIETCNNLDDNCDGETDEDLSCLSYGGHRVEKDGDYYYALYNDDGFGIIGSSAWYGSSDSSGGPEGVTWNEDFSAIYYTDLSGRVFSQSEPFTSSSTLVGTFSMGQIGGGVEYGGTYYVGDYANGDIYQMELSTGRTSLYASRGSTACKPYFGNSAMAIDMDGSVFAASSCGIVKYEPGKDAVQLNTYTGLISAVAMSATQDLYSLDNSGNVVQFDTTTGATLSSVRITVNPSTTWTLAIDSSDNILVNYWGEQRLYSLADGSLVQEWSAADYYPGTSGHYWYVTF
ncbi:MAG: hypothetical protein ACI9VR_002676 [Cognaticolwellia sp.]|jgi:hypothetical protein